MTPKRILVVDDNVEVAGAMAALLKSWGHEVFFVNDGSAAIDAARRVRPEIVLLDIGLPGMDGFQVAAALRRERGLEPLRVISMSGLTRADDVDRSIESGIDQHLSKPVDVRFLRSLLGPARS